jgi:hypothetical protein
MNTIHEDNKEQDFFVEVENDLEFNKMLNRFEKDIGGQNRQSFNIRKSRNSYVRSSLN